MYIYIYNKLQKILITKKQFTIELNNTFYKAIFFDLGPKLFLSLLLMITLGAKGEMVDTL